MAAAGESGGQAGYADGTSGTPLKRYLGATVLTADRIDYWIRRRVIACLLGSAGDAPCPAPRKPRRRFLRSRAQRRSLPFALRALSGRFAVSRRSLAIGARGSRRSGARSRPSTTRSRARCRRVLLRS
jgi:hypothetical protein